MPSLPSLLSSNDLARPRILARIDQRRRPQRRLLGLLALAVYHDDLALVDAVVGEALAWPEADNPQRTRKAGLLFAMTALLARAHYTELALQIAPLLPFAPGMAQVLVFSTEQPPQRFCWRVTPAYALVHGRSPAYFPIETLIEPYQRGQVSIDHAYLRHILMRGRRKPQPILLLPHPGGLVELGRTTYVILDGNHRVVCAWHQNRSLIPGYMLTPEEASAVLISHSQWPPYQSAPRTSCKL